MFVDAPLQTPREYGTFANGHKKWAVMIELLYGSQSIRFRFIQRLDYVNIWAIAPFQLQYNKRYNNN